MPITEVVTEAYSLTVVDEGESCDCGLDCSGGLYLCYSSDCYDSIGVDC